MTLGQDNAKPATASLAKPRRRLQPWAVWLALALLGLLLAAFYPSAPAPFPPVTILPLDYKIVPPPTPWPESWIPPTWGWLWRFHDYVLGRRKTTSIRVHVFQIKSDLGAITSSLGQPNPEFAGPNGVCAWPLSNADWPALRHRVDSLPGATLIANPQITTGDRCTAGVFIGSNVALGGVAQSSGVSAEFVPCAVKGMTELTFVLHYSEIATNPAGAAFLRTNFTAAARLRMTAVDATVFIDAADPLDVRTRTGLIIFSQPQAQ
jgi:hypothetical protein